MPVLLNTVSLIIVLHISFTDCLSEADVMKDVFRNYDPSWRPILDTHQNFSIHVSLVIRRVEEMNEQDEVLTTTAQFGVGWKDENLLWNPQTTGLLSVAVPPEKLWIPQFSTLNSISGVDDLSLTKLRPTLHSQGAVSANLIAILQTSCNVDLWKFPFDQQECDINVCPNAVNSYISLHLQDNQVISKSPHYFTKKHEWEVSTEQRIGKFNVDGNMAIDVLEVKITLKRKPTYYIIFLIIPATLTAFVSVLVFLLPPESGERVGLSVTILLSNTVFLTTVAQVVPTGGASTPILVIYITIMECAAVVMLSVNVVMLKLHQKKGEVDDWIKRFIVRKTKVHDGSDKMTPITYGEISAGIDGFCFWCSAIFISVTTLLCLLIMLM